MSLIVGQTVTKVITLRDGLNVPIEGLLEDDFATLEAFFVPNISVTELVVVDEIDEGQYALSFIPTEAGAWALHYVYDETPVFIEDTEVYLIGTTAEITVITAGGTWTYTGDLTDPAQIVRFLIQDTSGDYPLFTDTEVAYALGAAAGSTRAAAASLVSQLMARYAAMADTTELDLSVKASQLFEHYKSLHALLINTFVSGGSPVPYAGGISRSDILGNDQNTDRVRSRFDKYPTRPRYGGVI